MVAVAWVVVTAVLALLTVTGAMFSDSALSIAGAGSTTALATVEPEFPEQVVEDEGELLLVVQAAAGATVTDPAAAALVGGAVARAQDVPSVVGASNPFDEQRPLAGLALVRIPVTTEMGLGAAFGVVVAVLLSLTAVPAVLQGTGRRVLPKRERDLSAAVATVPRPDSRATTALSRWVHAVVRRPVVLLLAGTALVAPLAAPGAVVSRRTAACGRRPPSR